ncbi:hypothetical protein BpHYR1_013229 [Brachionus plicatilis]|uniref:Uncharacterized protein n=1 Tax=Brachionus plicatilis TaxID=10195 RepID=A0A3M7RSL4_BRAPC|nr:hypothetical protein BpHYR1_013229 [Brachionus plicatilis]
MVFATYFVTPLLQSYLVITNSLGGKFVNFFEKNRIIIFYGKKICFSSFILSIASFDKKGATNNQVHNNRTKCYSLILSNIQNFYYHGTPQDEFDLKVKNLHCQTQNH